jgi:hypothetical protein
MKKGRASQRLRAERSGLDFLRSLNQIKPRQYQPYDGKAVHAP